ncbi:MAG: type II methionyl aminopeptidase [Nitrososphaeraceae archaeon]|nr:type II methionyl aminopeptidase [Nitrososphaeraceae archaeon]MDW0134343.1 type II methionyl aminopeptidase [Nitrososphaeraceae archaeon]MDW0154791.1 type II methionyl aminopeptidase [Nitrososphaeraceae archaeon]
MDNFENYIKAGKIASEVREYARTQDHTGRTLSEICNDVENAIIKKGGEPAFPVNVSLNDIAAHYTAEPNDPTVVKNTDVLKIDVGVHIDGYIADTAVTVSYDSKYQDLIDIAQRALDEAIGIARSNTRVSDIGRIIEKTITKYGCKPIQNLSGHSLERYTIHAGQSIPNIWTIGHSFNLSVNNVYAIEPFVTTKDGQGIVYEGKVKNIFGIASRKRTKDQRADEFLEYLWNKFKTLPFALRWVVKDYEEKEALSLLETLLKKKNVHAYPILVEGSNRIVVQAEHTIIPQESNTITITK